MKLSTKALFVMDVVWAQSLEYATNHQLNLILISVLSVKQPNLTHTHSWNSKHLNKDHTLSLWWSMKKVNNHLSQDKKDKTHSLRIFLLKLKKCLLTLPKTDNIKERTGVRNSKKVERKLNAQWNRWRNSLRNNASRWKNVKTRKWTKTKTFLKSLINSWECSIFQVN